MTDRGQMVRAVEALIATGSSVEAAVRAVRDLHPAGPSTSTLRRWHAAWKDGRRDDDAIADRRRGRVRKPYGWEAAAIAQWDRLPRPEYVIVAFLLREAGWETATDSRVRRYLQPLVASHGGRSALRRGTKPRIIGPLAAAEIRRTIERTPRGQRARVIDEAAKQHGVTPGTVRRVLRS